MTDRTRLVYSSAAGRLCPECGRPVAECRCAEAGRANEAVPERIVAVLRLETKGRGGKTVTIVGRLPDNAVFLDDLAGALKRSCATGGAVRPGAIELAGDVRERVRALLTKRGYTVKG